MRIVFMSHGAGRKMSRGAAKRNFTLEDFKEQTSGVECRKMRAYSMRSRSLQERRGRNGRSIDWSEIAHTSAGDVH